MKKLFDRINKADMIYISVNNDCMSGYITAPAKYYYDASEDELVLGDEMNGVVIRNFSSFSADYDEYYDDFSLESEGLEFVVNF